MSTGIGFGVFFVFPDISQNSFNFKTEMAMLLYWIFFIERDWCRGLLYENNRERELLKLIGS